MSVGNCTFTSCSATQYGGAIYLSITSSPSTLLLTGIQYENNTAENGKNGVETTKGSTLFVSTTSSNYLTKERFPAFAVCDEGDQKEAYYSVGIGVVDVVLFFLNSIVLYVG